MIYRLELPFFERYKITKEAWPWHENREEWMK
jgi:sterol desaturase/sphingolipid hydroxylase (fatty acid hydroxylase superfamily)